MVEVPALLECPTCGLPCEAGNGPGNLAWHDCEWVMAQRAAEPTDGSEDPWEVVVHSVASAVRERAPSLPGRDLADILEAASKRPAVQQTGGISEAMRAFLEEDVPDDSLDE